MKNRKSMRVRRWITSINTGNLTPRTSRLSAKYALPRQKQVTTRSGPNFDFARFSPAGPGAATAVDGALIETSPLVRPSPTDRAARATEQLGDRQERPPVIGGEIV